MGGVTLLAQATGSEPAGGAAVAEAIGATVGALVVTTLIALVIAAHRSRRISWLHHLARFAERQTGLPGWAALPSAVMGLSLLTAALGMYWDISLHIDNGRDDGPLANPAHYLILVGLYGTLLAGVLSMALSGRERPCRTAVHLGGDWWAPVGGLMIAACGAFALTGFPLDDLWHRIFGQDVTLWGPTHLMLIGGGSLAVLGGMVLFAEGIREVGRDPERDSSPVVIYHLRRGLLVGGFLVALSTFQGEFDFGVPQFRLVLHPTLIMLAAGIGLVAARIYLGRGGALLAAFGFIAIRGFIAIMVGGVWDQTLPHFPLYLVEALLVELVFLRSAGRSPVATGALAGALIGTIGLAAEWGWSHVWMPIPWPASLLPEAAVAGLVTAVAGGAVGGFIGSALSGGLPSSAPALLPARLGAVDRRAALLGAVALVAVLAWNVPLTDEGPRSATIALRDVQPGPDRTVAAEIRIHPPGAVGDNPEFLNVTAWQGGGSVLDPLERTGPGEYRTTEPIPVYGGWKATLRLQQRSALVAVPIFQPLDRAIPAPETPASPAFTRSFQPDIAVLQRERKQDVVPALSALAYLTVLAIALALFALIAWSLVRLDAGGPRRRAKSRTSASRAELV
jgi:hypothetical protein